MNGCAGGSVRLVGAESAEFVPSASAISEILLARSDFVSADRENTVQEQVSQMPDTCVARFVDRGRTVGPTGDRS